MINNKFKILIIIFSFFYTINANSIEQFNFDVTEIEITNNGNVFKGLKRGVVTTNDGIELKANEFEYNKISNILKANGAVKVKDNINNYIINSEEITFLKNKNIIIATGNVKVVDDINNYIINSQKITYYKDKNFIITENKSSAESLDNNIFIKGKTFEYYKSLNKIIVAGNAEINDRNNNNKVFSNKITYFKNEEKFITNGKTKALINSEYDFNSEDVIFYRNRNFLSSKKNTTILDNSSNFYNLSNFTYSINKKELKGEDILVTSNYNLPKSDKFFFSSAIINLEKNNFLAKDTRIEIHKNIFSNEENDPRLMGVSSKSDGNKTVINKGIFTSCKKNDKCPPWSISAEQIEHDKMKKQITYNHATVKIYDKPVFYFPKFFHPDPTVERQSGFLKPAINNSNVLGSSLTLPYFKELGKNRDLTFKPVLFDSDIIMLQSEFRQSKEKADVLIDLGFVNGFKSSATNIKKNLNHIFFKYNHDLELGNFLSSDLNLSLEKTNNDTYLKLFDSHITTSTARPDSFNTLKNKFEVNLEHLNYNFDMGVISYEDLQVTKKSDRYQYLLPYYNFDKILSDDFFNGSLAFTSSGNNNLNNTNQLKSSIINDFSYRSLEYITRSGFSNNIDINLKNLNSIGKNSEYKSSPQSEIVSIFSFNSSIPLQKSKDEFETLLTPKVSLRINPSDMKNYSSSSKKINVGNIFNINRLGISDTYEAGRSLTIGFDYKKEKINNKQSEQKKELENINKYFELKLATVIRDKEENFIPKSSTLNRKNSNYFGSIDTQISENFKVEYDFALDNNLKELQYNNLISTIKFGDFETKFNFIEENGEMGDSNVLENSLLYNFDESNSLAFNTRRNRKLNLTEYYDLIYEYKNDCLTAGVKYKKTYYADRDVKPTENLLFTVTLFPLTTYEYNVDELVNN